MTCHRDRDPRPTSERRRGRGGQRVEAVDHLVPPRHDELQLPVQLLLLGPAQHHSWRMSRIVTEPEIYLVELVLEPPLGAPASILTVDRTLIVSFFT